MEIKMTHDELMKKWEGLFTDEYGNPSLHCLEIPESWYPLVDRLCDLITSHLIQNPNCMPFCVRQVKEKFGQLRFYCDNSDPYVAGLISMAESYSYLI